jgi:hypothetical protein
MLSLLLSEDRQLGQELLPETRTNLSKGRRPQARRMDVYQLTAIALGIARCSDLQKVQAADTKGDKRKFGSTDSV